jgi:hypothetical protein
MLLDAMHGDPRVHVASNRHGVLSVLPWLEHMACFTELCVFQKYTRQDLSQSPFQVTSILHNVSRSPSATAESSAAWHTMTPLRSTSAASAQALFGSMDPLHRSRWSTVAEPPATGAHGQAPSAPSPEVLCRHRGCDQGRAWALSRTTVLDFVAADQAFRSTHVPSKPYDWAGVDVTTHIHMLLLTRWFAKHGVFDILGPVVDCDPTHPASAYLTFLTRAGHVVPRACHEVRFHQHKKIPCLSYSRFVQRWFIVLRWSDRM